MFEVGKTYKCEYYTGIEKDEWIETRAKIIKRTKNSVTVRAENAPGWVSGKHMMYIDSMDTERADSYHFRMMEKNQNSTPTPAVYLGRNGGYDERDISKRNKGCMEGNRTVAS